MRIASVLILLVVVALGCNSFGADSGTSTGNSANSSSSSKAVKKLVDLPSLLGKTNDEMNTILGQKQAEKLGSVTYEIENGSVYAQFDSKTKKQVMLTFTFKTQTVDGATFRGYPTSKDLEKAAGLDLTGTPDKSEYEEKYQDVPLSGKKCEVTVKKMLEAYTGVQLYCI